MTTGMTMTADEWDMVRQNRDRLDREQDYMLTRSPDVARMVPYWCTVDDIVGGITTMRAATTRYLPTFSREEQTSYSYRLKLTKMTNIYRDIVEGLAAKPFEEEVALPVAINDDTKVETPVPQEILDFAENVDGAGNNLTVFSASTFFNGINSAIDWIFIDYPVVDKSVVRTVADAKAAAIRPYWSHVLGRNVLDCKSVMEGSNEKIVYMRIFEPGAPDHVRVFMRDGSVVTWELWEKGTAWIEKDGKRTQFVKISDGVLSIDVIPLVPFLTGRRDGRTWYVSPPMQDAVELQIDLYQSESGLKFAKTLTGYPMLAGNGISPPKDAEGKVETLVVGPSHVLYAPHNGDGRPGKWDYLEPSASSLTFLAGDIKETQQQLREIGRQPLTAQSSGITVINSAAAANKAKTAVGAWAYGLKDALENAFVITCKWLNIPDTTYDPVVAVFTEFDEFIDGKDLDALGTAVVAGKISDKTYRFELKRRGTLSAEFNEDAEAKELLAQVPADGIDNNPLDKPPPGGKPPNKGMKP